jgi:hypothetical protein
MAKRLNISLSDKADELLQSLAADCEMSVSQCLSQMVLRNHTQFRALFALDSTQTHEITPQNTDLHPITQEYTQLHGIVSKGVIEPQSVHVTDEPLGHDAPDFASLIANS